MCLASCVTRLAQEGNDVTKLLLLVCPTDNTGFIESEGVTIDEFLRECRGVVDGHFTALFEEHEHARFIDHLLASMHYDHFYTIMVREARRGARK